jgi:site-specific DNA-methyltransferase (adenine-specific)
MGKKWDTFGPNAKAARVPFIAWLSEIAVELLRVLKPGGHAFVWALPRTSAWTVTAFESAEWEVRDTLHHAFAQGTAKALDIFKALTKKNAVEAEKWTGWATAVRPQIEHWHLLRKPLSEKTVVDNVLKWKTGALNTGACRVPRGPVQINRWSDGAKPFGNGAGHAYTSHVSEGGQPGSFVLSHDPRCVKVDKEIYACVFGCPIRELDNQSGFSKTKRIEKASDCGGNTWGGTFQTNRGARGHSDQGGSSRFYNTFQDELDTPFVYQKKLSPSEKHNVIECTHPTPKSITFCQYMVRLITPPGGVVLDCFLGSGTTALACVREGFSCIGIEKEQEYFEIAKARVQHEVDHAVTV